MNHAGRTRVRWLALSMVVALIAVSGCSGEEQGGLEAASPGPDAVVGGEIDEVVLLYDDIIVGDEGSVVGPDGSEIAAEYRIDTDIRAVIDLEELLADPGVYDVRHAVETVDGNRREASYTFTFDPAAPAPQLVFPPEDDGVPWLLWIFVVVGAGMLVVLAVQLLASLRRLRSQRGGN